MKNLNDKRELETIKLERVPIETNSKEKNQNLCQIIIIIILSLCICLISYNLSRNKNKFKQIEPQFINRKTEKTNTY